MCKDPCTFYIFFMFRVQSVYIYDISLFFLGLWVGICIKIYMASMLSFASSYNYLKYCNNYGYIHAHISIYICIYCHNYKDNISSFLLLIYTKIFLELLVSCKSSSLSSLFAITISHRSKPSVGKLHLLMV